MRIKKSEFDNLKLTQKIAKWRLRNDSNQTLKMNLQISHCSFACSPWTICDFSLLKRFNLISKLNYTEFNWSGSSQLAIKLKQMKYTYPDTVILMISLALFFVNICFEFIKTQQNAHPHNNIWDKFDCKVLISGTSSLISDLTKSNNNCYLSLKRCITKESKRGSSPSNSDKFQLAKL